MGPRTFFVHVRVPEHVAAHLREVQKTVVPDASRHQDIDHVTLVHTKKPDGGGEHPPDHIETAVEKLRDVASSHEPIRARIQGWGYFDGAENDGRKTTALVALLDAPGLDHLHVDMARALKEHGIEPSDSHVFTPHITLGYGTRDDIQTNLILPFDQLGLKGLTLTLDATWRSSRVRDPATGQYRRIVGAQTTGTTPFIFTSMSQVTYDIAERNLQLGMTLHSHAGTREDEYRIDEISTNWHDFKLGVFAEYKPTPVWTLRLFARDIAQTAAFRDRDVYGGLRGAAPLAFVEHRSLSNGAMLGINVQHDF